MSVRARKTVTIGGVRVRLTPRSGSLQLGGRRARVTASRRGVSVGSTLIPGLSWATRILTTRKERR